MAASTRQFRSSILQEHLEEGAFLFEQISALRKRAGTEWNSLDAFETRLEAHVDALAVGGEMALSICQRGLLQGEAGVLFVVLSVLCRARQWPPLSQALHRASFDSTSGMAIVLALREELPEIFAERIVGELATASPALVPVLAEVCAYRRLAPAKALQSLRRPDMASPMPATSLKSLGRLGIPGARQLLQRELRAGQVAERRIALLALARLGVAPSQLDLGQQPEGSGAEVSIGTGLHPEHPRPFIQPAWLETWSLPVFAMCGDRTAGALVARIHAAGRIDASCLLSLGLLGETSHIQLLLDHLNVVNLASHAATALHWLTGASLFEMKFIPDEVVDEELFDIERAAWRERGERPKRIDGQPFGESRQQLSTNAEAWRRWWTVHGASLPAGTCFRRGRPHGPMALLADLCDPGVEPLLRAISAEELVIRYGCPVPFEVDMPVWRQLQALKEIKRWATSSAYGLPDGRWHFQGKTAA